MRFDESQLAFISNENYPYVCVANAGAGKSTSLLGKAHKLALDPGRNGKILILCFNRGIQEEMQEKIQAKGLGSLGVEVKTLHALGRQFVEQAVNVARKPLNCIPSARNSHLYYGFIRKDDRTKYGKYPGLINKILEELDAKSMNKALDVGLTTEINMHGLRILTEECPNFAPTDLAPEESKHYPQILALVSTLLRSIKKTSPSNVKLYAERISYDYIANVDLRRKPVDFWKFFTKRFYRNGFTNFVHACALEFIFKKDLYGRFAQDDIDNAPKVFPLFYAYCKELTPVNTYKRYSDLLEDNLAALIISDLVMQVNQWGELDFDSMLTLGAYSLLKIKGGNYHAILVDECQDLSLLYWYLVYEAYPKYLIHDKEKRLYFVGDRSQAINVWNYACPERFVAMANQHARGQLVYTYRCPQAIVDKAQALKEVSVCARIDLKEDKFLSAAPPEQQPGEYSHTEAMDATKIDAFFKEKGYRYEDAVILGRTNNDLLAWQMWLLITQVPCRELLVNKLELTSDKAKTLLALVAIADPSPDTPEIALEWLRNTKGEAATEYIIEQTYTASGDDLDAALLKFFTSLNLKDEEDLSEEEMQELNMGRGAISVLREWYAKNSFNLKDKLKSLIESDNFTLNMRPEGISLSTIHRYKGREKDIVLIQSNSWGAICKNAQDNIHQTNEELCLLYVSITRARRAVHIVKGNMHPLA